MKISPPKIINRSIASFVLGTSLFCHHMDAQSMDLDVESISSEDIDHICRSIKLMEKKIFMEMKCSDGNRQKKLTKPKKPYKNTIDTGPAINFPLFHNEQSSNAYNTKMPYRKNSLDNDETSHAQTILRRAIAHECKKNNNVLVFPGHGSYVKQLVTLEYSKAQLHQRYPLFPYIECTFTTSFLYKQGDEFQFKKITGSLSKSLPDTILFKDAVISDVSLVNEDVSKEERLVSLNYYEQKKTTIHKEIIDQLSKKKRPLTEGELIEFTLKNEVLGIIEDIGFFIGKEIPCLQGKHIQHGFSGCVILPNVGLGLIEGKIVREYSMNVPLLMLATVEISDY